MKKILFILLISILLCGCVSININVDNSKNEVVKELKKEEVDNTSYEKLGEEATNILEKDTISEKEESRVKSVFLTLTDFLFNGGTINGRTFEDLTVEAKSKFFDMYYKISNLMEEKFPNYKEEFPEKAKNTVSDLKNKMSDLKDKIKDEYREFVGDEQYEILEDTYESSKENLSEVYDIYKPYIDEAKEKGKSAYENAKEKASNWYQEYKES